MPASHVAIYNDLRGPNNSITLREAVGQRRPSARPFAPSSAAAADVMVAGATGTRVHPMKMVHSLTQEEVAGNGVDPTKASRPFDLNRSGMVLGEGAGAIVLEELGTAAGPRRHDLRRSDRQRQLVGGATAEWRRPAPTCAWPTSCGRFPRRGMRPDDVGHLHAHGLSTRSCDAEEAAAIRDVFGRGRRSCRSRPPRAISAIWGPAAAWSN